MNQLANVIWYKRDLRIVDHANLNRAAQAGPVLPLYIIEPNYWKLPDTSRRHWHFLHDSLVVLQRELQSLGLPLIIRIGHAREILADLREKLGDMTLWSHEETGNLWTYRRDREVAAWCRATHTVWHELPSHGVVRRLENRDAWAAIRAKRMSMPIINLPHAVTPVTSITSQELPEKNHAMFGVDVIGNVQAGGRDEGMRSLQSFLKERARNYVTTMSKPGVAARHCSRLSTHIAYGTLSVREIEQATKHKLETLSGSPDADAAAMRRNLKAFLSRLAWRCHFVQKLEQQPEIETHCMHAAFEGMREPHFREDFFAAWQQGKTGYPLVDACMRSLHANGWINFRMRAMLVSFASYHLWLDWRITAPHLAKLFTDYEPGVHYSQFQMQSGVTGINAIRMYNPIKQSIDQDAEGKFIRRYVPELQGVSSQWIHEPWRMSQPLANYPLPIVDHEQATKHARDEISKRWRSDGFRADASAVFQKLGSRAKRPAQFKKVVKKSAQLSFDI